ncbi:CoA ester lyase [Nocardia sp. 348MFTsu5.1]|uniref:HpcH/HpaI aldolase/citrate lyase family protein n=1 Tax=Nocardia sp. 348MFTsu5.1 TaxID=1172185 RepID=UPI0003A3EA58|nr:CoA ester lyase [Nocardia sp. 348MFTsu5.1]
MSRRRSVLVAPGSDRRKLTKALQAGADEVVLDLEDAVTPANKDDARALVVEAINSIAPAPGTTIAVRINSVDSPWAAADLAALAQTGSGLSSVVVPKVNGPADLEIAAAGLAGHGATLQALIETPSGLTTLDDICSAVDELDGLIIGYADLGAELGREPGLPPQRWAAIQDRVLIAARTAGIAAIDGPHLGTADDDEFRFATRWVRELGFDGKWVIHPRQIDVVTAEFTPSAEAVDRARRILAALDEAASEGAGAAQLDGQMLDEAVAVSARRTLAKVEEKADV